MMTNLIKRLKQRVLMTTKLVNPKRHVMFDWGEVCSTMIYEVLTENFRQMLTAHN